MGWRDFFGDPLLQELLALSLANNRDLRVAALNVEAARLNPSGQAGISRSYQVGASLSTWELDLFGRIRSLSEQALQLYLAQDETRLATQLTLVAETANAYLTLRADQELLALTRQTLAAQQESYKLTRQSYDLGVATELDLSQAEISLRTAERNLSQYTRMAAQDRNALVLLVGQPLPAGIGAQLDQAVALRASLDLAKIQKDIGIARYEQAIQSGFREVSDALAGRGTLQEQIRSQELLVQANQRAYDLSQQRYQQGIDNYLSVLDSQRSLYTAQQTLVETRLARLSNLIQLYKALGGGWSERTVAAAQAG
ncbi:outer membrane lipoprotein [Bordetella pertussis]|nr:outer membrane lipoprotein [Bordetella pertussis]